LGVGGANAITDANVGDGKLAKVKASRHKDMAEFLAEKRDRPRRRTAAPIAAPEVPWMSLRRSRTIPARTGVHHIDDCLGIGPRWGGPARPKQCVDDVDDHVCARQRGGILLERLFQP
jgi:hypothetical protein